MLTLFTRVILLASQFLARTLDWLFGRIHPDLLDFRVSFHEFLQGLDALAASDLGWFVTTAQEFILHGHWQDTQHAGNIRWLISPANVGTIQIEQIPQECNET